MSGPIHVKVNLLQKPALASRETMGSLGIGGIAPHRRGFHCLYHGFFDLATDPIVAILAVVAWL
jgi:hypothetical protein